MLRTGLLPELLPLPELRSMLSAVAPPCRFSTARSSIPQTAFQLRPMMPYVSPATYVSRKTAGFVARAQVAQVGARLRQPARAQELLPRSRVQESREPETALDRSALPCATTVCISLLRGRQRSRTSSFRPIS